MATKRPCLRKSTRTQANAEETNGVGDPCKVDNDSKLSEPFQKTQTRRKTKLKKDVTEKTDVIYIDEESGHGDGSFTSQSIPSCEKDTFLCSQDTSAEVFWDCTSPDMRKVLRSRHKRDKQLKNNVVDIVQTLSTMDDVDTEDTEDKSKNGLLGLWMDSEVPDSSSKFTSTNLTSFSPTNSFLPQRAQKEKREAADTLSSVLKEKLSMRIKKERSPMEKKIRSAEKRKCSSLSGITESPSKVSKVEEDDCGACDLRNDMEKLSETSWSEDDFYEEDSFIIRATQAPGELSNKCETKTSDKGLKDKVCAKTPGKYSDQKNTGSLPNRSSNKTRTKKNDFNTSLQRPSGSMKSTTHTITKTVSPSTSDVKKKSKRNSLGLNSSLSDDILCQIVETDCILDSQIENVKQDNGKDLKKSPKNSSCDTAKKTNSADHLRTSSNTKSKCSDQVNECVKDNSGKKNVSKEYTFVCKSRTVQPSTASQTFQGVPSISSTTSCSEKLSNSKEIESIQSKNSMKPASSNLPDESADLFQSDEEDLLSEPQVLALLDAVESQVPMANCSFSSSQPNMTPEKSSHAQTKSPCKRRNISENSQAHIPRKCTPQEIELKKSAAVAKRLSSSQPTSSQTLCSPEKGHNQSISPQKCTPEEIEQKRQAAIAKKLSSSQEFSNSQTKHDSSLSVCLSPIKGKITEVSSSKSSPRKCSPEEIQRKRELALKKRQKKGPETVNAPVLSTVEPNKIVGERITYPETPVCGVQKVNGGDGNSQSDANKCNSLQDVIEKKRLEALKRRELKLKASQACKS